MPFDPLETTRLASNDAEFEDLECDFPTIEVENSSNPNQDQEGGDPDEDDLARALPFDLLLRSELWFRRGDLNDTPEPAHTPQWQEEPFLKFIHRFV
jgi:hypothetical protein